MQDEEDDGGGGESGGGVHERRKDELGVNRKNTCHVRGNAKPLINQHTLAASLVLARVRGGRRTEDDYLGHAPEAVTLIFIFSHDGVDE